MTDDSPKQPGKRFVASALRALEWMKRRWAYGREKKQYKQFSPHQRSMADALGCSIRQLRAYLAWLEGQGFIRRRRGMRGNSYIFLEGTEIASTGGNCRSPAAETADPQRRKLPIPSGGNCRSPAAETAAGCNKAEAAEEELNEKKQQQAEAAAAAGSSNLFSKIEIQDAVTLLTSLDLPEAIAARFAEADCPLAVTAAAYAAARFRDVRRKPIRNKVGFLRAMLSDPARYGFIRLAGGDWLPPPDRQPQRTRFSYKPSEPIHDAG